MEIFVYLLAIPAVGELILCILFVIPLGTLIMIIYSIVLLFEGEIEDFFGNLLPIALGTGVSILLWPYAWEAVKLVFNLFN